MMDSLLTAGFPVSMKENERRRALLPCDAVRLKYPGQIYVETGYGYGFGLSDNDYSACGVHVCSRDEVLSKNIICDPKVGDAEYLAGLHNQIVFGWLHAVQNRDISDKIVAGHLSAFAWECMFEEGGRHVFWRNNEIAGEAAVMHAFACHGSSPANVSAAVLGRGNTARGAIRALSDASADIVQYCRQDEQKFRNDLGRYDVIVNCILWDTTRLDHIIYRRDLKRMKNNALIIDISCDRCGGIETSVPTSIDDPVYKVDGITHYVVDNVPSLLWKASSESISAEVAKYLDSIVDGTAESNPVLNRALQFKKGEILDSRILEFQSAHSL